MSQTQQTEREYVNLPSEMHYATEYGVATRFNRSWAGHRFTDTEVEALARGESITFTLTRDDGSTEQVTGKLEGKLFSPDDEPDKVIAYVGFTKQVNPATHAEGTWARTGKKIKFKRTWGTHTFTEDEIAALLRDEAVGFVATSKRTGNEYEATGKLQEQFFDAPDGRRVNFIGFKAEFEDRD